MRRLTAKQKREHLKKIMAEQILEENKYNRIHTLWHIYDLLGLDGQNVKSIVLENFEGSLENIDNTYVDEWKQQEHNIESKYPNEEKNWVEISS